MPARPASAGATARPCTARPRRSTAVTIGGPAGASGGRCSPPWPRRAGSPRRRRSTAPTSRSTARRAAAKGGAGAGRRWRCHRSVPARGGDQRIAEGRGGRTTKAHLLTDVLGRPVVVHLTSGNASDVGTAPDVLAAVPGRRKRLIADRGDDAHRWCWDLREAGTIPIVPGSRARKRPVRHDRRRYRDRRRVEAAICRRKGFRRVATRYDKLAANFASAVALAASVAFWC